MVQALVLLFGAIVLIRRAPDLPLSRLLDEWLARRPAAWLLARTRRELIAWAIVAAMLAFAGEYILVLGGPQLAIPFALDLAAYVDAAIALATIGSVARVRMVTRWLARGSRAVGPRGRHVRARRGPRALPPANDADDGRGQRAA